MIRRQEVVHWRSPEVSLTTRVRERERDREGVACGNGGGLGGPIDPIEIGTRHLEELSKRYQRVGRIVE